VVSVGPEPGGAPPSVLHVGGGPDRFCAILERQIALDAELGAFAVPRDAAWAIEEPGFDLAREHEIESLLAIANGYVGSRGSIAEGSSASLSERHLLVERVEVCPLNYSGTMAIEAILCGDVRSESGARHWAGFDAAHGGPGPELVGRTREGLVVALASHLEALDGAQVKTGCARAAGPASAAERCEIALRLGEPCALHRAVALASSRDTGVPRAAAEERCFDHRREPPEESLARHVAAWAERWRRGGVTIDGEPRLERALRFALYHLISAANPADPRCSIGARALTGEAYRGHVFWDADIFMLPFFAHAYPKAARALVGYRQRTLAGAQRKAAAYGYRGALYAWESTDTGDETTPAAVVSPFGELLPVLCGEEEHHISADVAYAAVAYARVTGDRAALRGAGRDVLVETARFWASRVTRGPDGLFHILRVIGPDEYHEGVDDNAFTNWMARFNLRRAALAAAAGGDSEEARAFRAIADAMYLGLDERTGLIEQFRGFHDLELVDLSEIGLHHAPADLVLGRERIARSQVIKQADVVMLLALLWDEVPKAVRRRCFLHYEPRTAHGSSLSPGVHALVAARLGLVEEAERYLEQTADIDLGNTMGNSAGGVHAAALGSLWQAVVLGVGGVRPAPDDGEALWIEPHLLPSIRHLGFPLTWRGRELQVDIDGGGIEVSIEGDAPLGIRALGAASSASVSAAPGRRYAARRDGDGFAAWEVIA
jgi:kojibiose phosphorylase